MGPYNPNQPQQNYEPDPRQASFEKEADFEDIQDDYEYQLAQQLYYAEPDESARIGREIFGLFRDDLAVGRVESRRSIDLVNIETFRSERGLYDYWDEVLDAAEY